MKSIEGEYYPAIALEGSYGVGRSDGDFPAIAARREGRLFVELDWNIYSGGYTDARVEESRVGVLKSSLRERSLKLDIREEVHRAYIELRRGADNIRLADAIAKMAKKKFLQAKKRYENGLGDYLELQNAQQEYIASLIDLTNYFYDYYIALAQLDYAIGR
jgi:outer membrane protein TolC